MNICVFGDSIVCGFFDNEKGGWVERIKIYLWKKDFNGLVYNLGVNGDTTEDILIRFVSEVKPRAIKSPLLIFAIGVNDSRFLIKEKRMHTSIGQFEKNINKLISQAKKYTKNIVFVSLTPADKKKVSLVPWDTNMIYNNIYIERYNSKLKEVCQKEKVKFVDLYGKIIKMDYKKLLEDGLHPNSKGHEWMADKIIKELKL